MQLTILGKSPSWPDAGGACSGYLLEHEGVTVLVDCGNGVFGKLREQVDYADVDAVLISHLHADHFLDLVPYSYALLYGPRALSGDGASRPRLIAPPGAHETFGQVTRAWGADDLISRAFELEEYSEDSEPVIGDLRFGFQSVPHFTQTFAVSIQLGSEPERRMVYGADSCPSAELVAFARDCRLLLIEATLARAEGDGDRGHLTAREAGQHAADAGADRVVLTHISDELDERAAESEAAEAFGGPVEVARGGASYNI